MYILQRCTQIRTSYPVRTEERLKGSVHKYISYGVRTKGQEICFYGGIQTVV